MRIVPICYGGQYVDFIEDERSIEQSPHVFTRTLFVHLLLGASDTVFGFPHHLDLTVSDISASVVFYETVLGHLGYERTNQYTGGAPCWLYSSKNAPTFGNALHQATKRADHDRYAPGMHHLAFNAHSRDEVVSFHRYLLENGIEILDAPAEYSYTPGYYAVFFADPDGMKLELVYEPNPDPVRA